MDLEMGPLDYLRVQPKDIVAPKNIAESIGEMPLRETVFFPIAWYCFEQSQYDDRFYKLLLQRRTIKIGVPHIHRPTLREAYVRPAYAVLRAFFLQEEISLSVMEATDHRERGYPLIARMNHTYAAFFISSGSRQNRKDFQWDFFECHGQTERRRQEPYKLVNLNCGGLTELLGRQAVADCEEYRSRYALITDGSTCLPIKHRAVAKPVSQRRRCYLHFDITRKVPARMVIADLLFRAASDRGLLRDFDRGQRHRRPVLGALNQDCAEDACCTLSLEDLEKCKGFSDFDLYTLQRSEKRYEQFVQWHDSVRNPERRKRVQMGDSFRVEAHAFLALHHRLRPIAYHPSIPETTARYFHACRMHRPRIEALDDLLQEADGILFRVTESVRTGEPKYSQVFFGIVGDTQVEVCLKLFDERYFSIPSIEEFDCNAARKEAFFLDRNGGPLHPDERLLTLNTAEDMARRELAAYEDCGLKHMQGIMIPHCYGVHRFTLPDGYSAYGLVLERVPGPSLPCTSPAPNDMSVPAQISLIQQLRECTRMLKLSGIEQTDWHANQVICTPRGLPMDRDTQTFNYELVLIDFAFALQRLHGEGYGLPPTTDVKRPRAILAFELGVPNQLVSQYWDNDYMDDEF